MPGGRPTDYRPEYCTKIIDVCGGGASVTEFAHEINTTPQTIYNWSKAHPEFFDAFTRARAACQTWWERKVRENLQNREYNSRLVEFMMSNMFPDHYGARQKIEIEHRGQVNVRSLSREELVRLASQVIDVEEVKTPELAQPCQPEAQNNGNETPAIE